MLLVLVGIVGLYVGPALSLVSTWRTSHAQQARVRALEREHAVLLRRERALRDPLTVAAEARRMGMVLPGEIPYVVRRIPGE